MQNCVRTLQCILATDSIKDELVKSGHLSNEDVLYSTKLWHKQTLMDWLLCTANQLGQNLLADKILSLTKFSTAKVLCYKTFPMIMWEYN